MSSFPDWAGSEKPAGACQRPHSRIVRCSPVKCSTTGFVMSVLNLPRPGWMAEDLVLLEEQARRFIATEDVPHLDTWYDLGMYDREVWTKAGAAGLLCPAIPEEHEGAAGTCASHPAMDRELDTA